MGQQPRAGQHRRFSGLGLIQLDDQPPGAFLLQCLERLQRHQRPAPDDSHPLTHLFDFREYVRRQEDRLAAVLKRLQDLVEGFLHQRIEPQRRLVEDGEVRLVLQRQDQAQLLAIPVREVFDRLR